MIIDLAVGVLAGLGCGVVFFGGLRWTVSKLDSVRRPAALMISSLLARTAVVTVAIVLTSDSSLVRVVAALGGMLIVRTAMVAVVRREVSAMEVTSWT